MKKILTILAAAILSGTALAQQVRTAYFLDGYDFRHQMNPALASARSYFILPVLGYTNVAVQSNMAIKNFLYPTESGQMATFMHESVPYDTFAKKLKEKNTLAADISTSLISIGAWSKMNSFYTVEINLKGNVNVNIPKSFFTLLKSFGGDTSYSMGDMGVKTREYLEFAFGYSRKLTRNFSFGAKIKALAGIADADINIKNLAIDMNSNLWKIALDGTMRMSAGSMIKMQTFEESGRDSSKPENQIDMKSFGFDSGRLKSDNIKSILSGGGLAFDLGIAYEFEPVGLTLTAAILDLGFICWDSARYAATQDAVWSFSGFDNMSLNSGEDDFIGDKFKDIFKELSGDTFAVFKQQGKKSYVDMLATTLNAGMQFKMPFYKSMSISALLTSRIQKKASWTEGRIALNFAFGNAFGLSASYGVSTFGSTFGGALNLHCKGLSFYLAADAIPTKFSAPLQKVKIGIPISRLNVGINFGLAFNVSNRRDNTFKTAKSGASSFNDFISIWD